MRAWLRQHAELVGLSAELTVALNALGGCKKQLGEFQERLSAELLNAEVAATGEVSLSLQLQSGQRHVEKVESAFRERDRLEVELARTKRDLVQSESELVTAEVELNGWRMDWADALLPLQLDANALPEQAEAVLANLDELFRNLDLAEGYRTRIWGIDETAKEFTQAARDACSVFAPDLVDLPVEQIVPTLNQRLSAGKEARQNAESLADRLAGEERSLREAELDLDSSRATLNVLREEAACETLAELAGAITKSGRKKALESDVKDLETQLAPLCAGRSLDEFVADAEGEDADRLPAMIDELGGRITSLREERDEAIKARERELGILKQYDGAAAAAEKAEERQFVLSRLEDDVHEYTVAIVASRLLRRAVERYREKAQGPVLSTASGYFRKLTRDAFVGLRSDFDESGQEVLVGVRPGGAPLRVEAMSEGTRDQLYLALRLGTLEHWFERHEPIPFVIDDVLLAFDDGRASAALATLVDLSKRTQVLLFTHHEHLVSLVRNVVAADDSEPRVNIVTEWHSDLKGIANA